MHKIFIRTAAFLGALSVAIGAFGAHALTQMAKDEALRVFETAVRYQFYHVFALLFTGILYKNFADRFLVWAGISFVTGILLFSGSLYFITYARVADIQGYRWIGAVTPFGGLFFIAGWLCLFVATFRNKII